MAESVLEQRANVRELVAAGHEDVNVLAALLQKIIDKMNLELVVACWQGHSLEGQYNHKMSEIVAVMQSICIKNIPTSIRTLTF
jgi:hypothetical protein